jgi:hypothetical protein
MTPYTDRPIGDLFPVHETFGIQISDGKINDEEIWDVPMVGNWDFIIDIDNNGIYNPFVDYYFGGPGFSVDECGDGIVGYYEWCGFDYFMMHGFPDLTRDCRIDVHDLGEMAKDFGMSGTGLNGDLNGDGFVDEFDLMDIQPWMNQEIPGCFAMDELQSVMPTGELSISFSPDPTIIDPYLWGQPPGDIIAFVVANNANELRGVEFGLMSSSPIMGFTPGPDMVGSFELFEGMTIGKIGEASTEPVVIGELVIHYTGEPFSEITIMPNVFTNNLMWTESERYAEFEFSSVNPGYIFDMEPMDTDSDGVLDMFDNCIEDFNPDQIDSDEDGFGATCDCRDYDGLVNPAMEENCRTGYDDNCNGQTNENCRRGGSPIFRKRFKQVALPDDDNWR